MSNYVQQIEYRKVCDDAIRHYFSKLRKEPGNLIRKDANPRTVLMRIIKCLNLIQSAILLTDSVDFALAWRINDYWQQDVQPKLDAAGFDIKSISEPVLKILMDRAGRADNDA